MAAAEAPGPATPPRAPRWSLLAAPQPRARARGRGSSGPTATCTTQSARLRVGSGAPQRAQQ
eukprot:9392290-Alexandrium_andersonii.AAC.1